MILMLGCLEDHCYLQSSLFSVIPEARKGGFNSTMFNYYLRTRIVDIWGARMTPEQYEQVFNALRWYYIDWPYLEDLDANREAFNKVFTCILCSYRILNFLQFVE
jgi:hypothetical protein